MLSNNSSRYPPYLKCHTCVITCGSGETVLSVSSSLSLARFDLYVLLFFSFHVLLVYLVVRLLLCNASPLKNLAESGGIIWVIPHRVYIQTNSEA